MTTNPLEDPAVSTNPNPLEDPAVSTESTDPGPDATTAPEGTDPQAEAGEAQQSTGNREAANYRTKLRAAEAERDRLAGTVVAFQRAEVERLASTLGRQVLATPSDLWLAGVKQEDLLAEDGTVDKAKVGAAVAAVLADHPNWGTDNLSARRLPRDMGQGRRGDAVPDRSAGSVMRKVVTGR